VVSPTTERLSPGDGAAASDEPALELRALSDSQVRVFDLA
jgi:hypothetical protein